MSNVSESPDLALLRAMSQQYPTAGAAIAELIAQKAQLLLPLESIHVISDVHGEYAKLRHVINNASGKLRPLVERLFTSRLTAHQREELLSVLYYPQESMEQMRSWLAEGPHSKQWVGATLRRQFEMVREMGQQRRLSEVTALFPSEFKMLFGELLGEPLIRWESIYVDEMLDALAQQNQDLAAVRAASHLVRNLAFSELIVAGDLGDRGPRIDKVIEYLRQQPNVSIVWGNHDAQWMGACLGQEASISSVLRFSTRYNRLAQLEEGYGIPLEPLEKLARDVYGNDPCKQFSVIGKDLRDEPLLRKMQKAIAIIQFKLEAQTFRRHPDWKLEHRNLLHRINREAGTVEIDGKTFPLLDRNLPTLAGVDPYALTPPEVECMARMREAFANSKPLWEQMRWIVERGHLWMRRGEVLIFHACVAVDKNGKPLTLNIGGKELAGRAQMDALDGIVRRAFRAGAGSVGVDADWFWYLWAGERSPLFGKDKSAAFEGYFVANETARHEKKNPYFELINDAAFCKKIGRDFGMDDNVLIVNGHVPVRVEKGENPLKRGGNAVTIDGAFSQAYGDRGFTLLLDAGGITLAEHAHFESIEEVIKSGADMVPKTVLIRRYEPARAMGQGSRGAEMRQNIALLQHLIDAYRNGLLPEKA
jgi:fructose-1,6-bisphosphatase III